MVKPNNGRAHWIAPARRPGAQGISIERLARRLEVTHGSFYHHFANRAEFVCALLAECENDYTHRPLTAITAITAITDSHDQRERLGRYRAVTANSIDKSY